MCFSHSIRGLPFFFWAFYGVQIVSMLFSAFLIRLSDVEMWALGTWAALSFVWVFLPYWTAAPFLLRLQSRLLRATLGSIFCLPYVLPLAHSFIEMVRRGNQITRIDPLWPVLTAGLVASLVVLTATNHLTERTDSRNERPKMPSHKNRFQFNSTNILTGEAIVAAALGACLLAGFEYFAINMAIVGILGLQAAWFQFITKRWRFELNKEAAKK